MKKKEKNQKGGRSGSRASCVDLKGKGKMRAEEKCRSTNYEHEASIEIGG